MVKTFSLFSLNITFWKYCAGDKLTVERLFVVVGCREQGERTRLLLISFSEDKVLKACLLSQKRFPARRLPIAAVCLNHNFHEFLAVTSLKGCWTSSTSLLFYSWAFGSFAISSLVGLRRQTVQQIRRSTVWLNDILLRRHANRKENSGRSVLKTTLS